MNEKYYGMLTNNRVNVWGYIDVNEQWQGTQHTPAREAIREILKETGKLPALFMEIIPPENVNFTGNGDAYNYTITNNKIYLTEYTEAFKTAEANRVKRVNEAINKNYLTASDYKILKCAETLIKRYIEINGGANLPYTIAEINEAIAQRENARNDITE